MLVLISSKGLTVTDSNPQAVPRGYAPFGGNCPKTGKPTTFLLSVDKFKSVQRHQPYWKIRAVESLESVLRAPLARLKDLKRDGFQDAYCVTGKPATYHKSNTVCVPFPPGFLLCVIVAWDSRGWLILDWEQRKEDSALPGVPVNGHTDFGEIIWTANSRT